MAGIKRRGITLVGEFEVGGEILLLGSDISMTL
jgi:hypothetical protein